MNWIASEDDFVRHVEALIKREYSHVVTMQPEGGPYIFWESGLGGLAQLLIHTTEGSVAVDFIKSSPDSTHGKAEETFPYAEASLKPIARVITEWIEARRK